MVDEWHFTFLALVLQTDEPRAQGCTNSIVCVMTYDGLFNDLHWTGITLRLSHFLRGLFHIIIIPLTNAHCSWVHWKVWLEDGSNCVLYANIDDFLRLFFFLEPVIYLPVRVERDAEHEGATVYWKCALLKNKHRCSKRSRHHSQSLQLCSSKTNEPALSPMGPATRCTQRRSVYTASLATSIAACQYRYLGMHCPNTTFTLQYCPAPCCLF